MYFIAELQMVILVEAFWCVHHYQVLNEGLELDIDTDIKRPRPVWKQSSSSSVKHMALLYNLKFLCILLPSITYLYTIKFFLSNFCKYYIYYSCSQYFFSFHPLQWDVKFCTAPFKPKWKYVLYLILCGYFLDFNGYVQTLNKSTHTCIQTGIYFVCVYVLRSWVVLQLSLIHI